MRSILFFLILTIINGCCLGKHWALLEEFKDTFSEYNRSAEDMIAIIQNHLKNTSLASSYFIQSVDKFINRKGVCSIYSCVEFYELEIAFNMQVGMLEMPLLKNMAELSDGLVDMSFRMSIYQRLADNKFLSCKLTNDNCTETTQEWLRSELLALSCRLDSNCVSHSTKPKSLWPIRQDCSGKFECRNSKCVAKGMLCNGFNDCGDNSDEEGCATELPTTSNYSLEFGMYHCNNRRSVNLSSVCDGRDDCGDGSDEGENCKGSCPQGCQPRGVCFRSPEGALCLSGCPRGTFESTSWCNPLPQHTAQSISELIADITHLISHHSAALTLLKIRTLEETDNLIWKMALGNDKLSTLAKITKLVEVHTDQHVDPSHNTTAKPK